MDLQGAELLALKGSIKSLPFCKSIFVEVSKGEVYKNAPQYIDIIEFLKKFNFKLISEMDSSHTNILFKKL